MTDPDDPAHRRHTRAPGDEITVREPEEVDDEDGVFEVRMPIASTGKVRNDGDDPLSRNELSGMASQLSEREVGVFPAHGGDQMIASGRYSPFEKLGVWRDGDIQERGSGEEVLMATARMPDPETLPAATGDYRQGLAILKEQAMRGIPLESSIGWRDDEEFRGGVDLMEASIVGIGADWRTNTGDEQAEVVARAAIDAGADPGELVERVADAVDADREDRDTDVSMTDDDSGTDAGTTDEQDADDGETTERADAPEWAARMLDLLENLNSAIRESDDSDDEEDDEEDEEEQAADDPDDTQESDDADTESEQSADPDDADGTETPMDERIAELEDALESLRAGEDSVETPEADPDDEQDADSDDADTDDRAAEDDTDETPPSPTEGLGDYR